MQKSSSAPIKGFSLNAKICTLATGLAVLSLAVTAAVIGYKNTAVSEEGTLKQVQTSTQALASKLETRISANFSAVSALAQAVQSTQGSGASLSREQIADLVKATLTGSEDFIGAAVTMEPNALDGKDSEYASKSAWYDATGRYMPYWTKSAGGNLHVDPIVFDSAPGANDWYDIPKKTNKVYFTEPYIYPIEGKDVMMASLVAPIIVKGNFQGVASADFTLSQLNKLMNSVQTIEGSSLSLISNGGMYVANDDAKLVNKKVEDLSEEALQHVKNGTSYVFVDKFAGVITLLEPVRSHANAAPWSVRVSFPLAAATAVSRELLMYTIAVSLVCAVLAAIALFAGINRLMGPVRKLAEAMKGLADGTQGLSARLAETGTDELSDIAKGFNAFVSKIQSVIATVKTNADSVSLASAEISAGNNNLSARTESQASALQQTAASMEELSSQVKLNAQNSEQASTLASQATAVATKGGKAVTDVVATMKDINESSRKISEIISVIDGIAFQTNILALNASVEAARAGEQGRGFAVVASEVRNLAGRSAQAAKEIKDLITASVTHVQKGTEQVGAAGATIGEVVASIQRVSDLVSEISVASKEQAQGVAQVGEAVTQMDEATQQNAALVEEMAAAAGSLNTQAAELVTAVASFGGAPQNLPTLKAPAFAQQMQAMEPRRETFAPTAPDRLKASTSPIAIPVGNETDWETF